VRFSRPREPSPAAAADTGSAPGWLEEASGPIRPVSYHDLGGMPGFKLTMQRRGDRWFLYVAHLWHPGWSILEVTDPNRPELIRFMPGPPNTRTLQIAARHGLLATSLEPIPSGWGGRAGQAFEEGFILWDLADPSDPRRRGVFRSGHRGVHRLFFDHLGLLHVPARMPGYRGCIYLLVDPSDPEHPREVGRFHVPGQHADAGEQADREWSDHDGLHGPVMRCGDLAYLGYGSAGLYILDISRADRPALVGHLPLHPPLGSPIAAHTVVPFPERGIALVNSEAIAERCQGPLDFAAVVDVGDPTRPVLKSLFPTPYPPPGSPYPTFCDKGGRFGPHNPNISTGEDHYLNSDTICFMAYFNAGLRVFDTSVVHRVEEIASLVPGAPAQRRGPLPSDLVVQVEDVLVDSRGFVFFTEKNSGLYIARWATPQMPRS
jgi:hypothetical protein